MPDAGPTPGHLTLSPAAAAVSVAVGRTPAAAAFTALNDGSDLLHFGVVCPGAVATPASGVLAAGASSSISVALPVFSSAGIRTLTCDVSSDTSDAVLTFIVTLTVTADATPPAVTLTSPQAAATLSGKLTLVASASDDVGVASVAFLVDGQSVASSTGAPFSAQWDSATVANGAHQLAARAVDAAGNATTSAAVAVTVQNLGHLTRSPASAHVSVNAGSPAPPVALTIGNDGTAALHYAVSCDGSGTASPASGLLAAGASTGLSIGLPAYATLGSRTVTCTATTPDATGGPQSFPITVDVLNDTTAPTVTLTAPVASATLTGNVSLTATAADQSGVASVDFLVDGSVIASSTVAPYSASWSSTSVANGAHAVAAQATDVVGNRATTPSVSILVANGHLTLAPATGSVSTSAGQPTPGATFTVGNDGPAPLHFIVVCDNGATASPASGGLAANVSSNVSVSVPAFTTSGTRTVGCTATTADGSGGPRTFVLTVTVGADLTAPTVNVTGPAAGAVVHGSVSFSASAADGVGVVSVQYFVDGAAVGASAAGPTWSANWSSATVADGQHSVVAKASDAAGNVGTSNAITFTVNNSSPTGASLSVHTTLGVPDGNFTVDPSNTTRYLSVKHQYVVSYNATLKVPNWVSWEVNSSWFGSAARQNDFRIDDTLPSPLAAMQGQLADYSGSGYDRGHMCPSADRESSVLDNSNTFYLTNMIPQAPNNNQGPWADLENYARTLALSGKELFIVSGPVFDDPNNIARTRSGAGVAIPSSTFKVIVVLDSVGQGAANVTTTTRVIAVLMTNALTIPRADPWTRYCSTARAIEAKTGLNFLSDVPQSVQDVVETQKDSSCP